MRWVGVCIIGAILCKMGNGMRAREESLKRWEGVCTHPAPAPAPQAWAPRSSVVCVETAAVGSTMASMLVMAAVASSRGVLDGGSSTGEGGLDPCQESPAPKGPCDGEESSERKCPKPIVQHQRRIMTPGASPLP